MGNLFSNTTTNVQTETTLQSHHQENTTNQQDLGLKGELFYPFFREWCVIFFIIHSPFKHF